MNLKDNISRFVKRKLFHVNIYSEKWLLELCESLEINDGNSLYKHETNIDNFFDTPVAITYKKELAINKLLDSGKYTFKNALVITNPYKIATLSALLIFKTDSACKVEYIIKGQYNSPDYKRCDNTFTTRHKVPILGLYQDCYNFITVNLLDENDQIIASNRFFIYTFKLKEKYMDAVRYTKPSESMKDEFTLVSGGYNGTTYAFDNNGNIRYMLKRPPHPYGIHMLENGHFLYVEKNMRRPNYGNAHSVVMHEMDFLGRVYKTYYHPNGFHHWAISEKNTGNFLIASSSIKDSFGENMIIEIERSSGKILNEINVNDLFDKTYVTRHDWAHVNAFDYIPEEEAIIVSMRNIHTIAKISLKEKKICWILANPDFYEKTEQRNLVLKPEEGTEWFFQQHAVQILKHDTDNHIIKIALFDNHTANRRPVDYFDNRQNSYLMVYTIDENNMTVTQNKKIETELSITRSNLLFSKDHKSVYAMCGNLKNQTEDCRAKILEYDYSSGKCKNEIILKNDFFAGYFISFDIEDMSKDIHTHMEPAVGELYQPEITDKLPVELNKSDLTDISTIPDVKFRMFGDVLQIYCRDHSIEKVYLYNSEKVYVQDFTDTKQTIEVFAGQRYNISIPLNHVSSGKYSIAVKYLGKYYKTEYRITTKND